MIMIVLCVIMEVIWVIVQVLLQVCIHALIQLSIIAKAAYLTMKHNS